MALCAPLSKSLDTTDATSYAQTWEDPAEDMKHFDLKADDSMMCITSAGCNALHYLVAARECIPVHSRRDCERQSQSQSAFIAWISIPARCASSHDSRVAF